MKDQTPRRHHIIPQVLLRQFADSLERIQVVPKSRKPSRVQHIRNVSVVNDANTLQTSSGKDVSLELLLAGIENYYPAILASLDDENLSTEKRALLLSLVTTQFARDPYHRAWIGDEVALIYEALSLALREEDPTITDRDLATEIEHYAKQNIVKPHINHNHTNVAVAAMSSLLTMSYQDFAECNLTVLRSACGNYVTGDSPLFLFDRYEIAERRDIEAERCGFLAETEITMPITSRHAVLLTAVKTPNGLVDVGQDVISIVNARTVRSCVREVYCAPQYPAAELSIHMSQWWWRRAILSTL